MLRDKKILLIISGGISAYKSLELIRLLKKNHAEVICILTKGGEKFVTPLSVSSLSQNKVFQDLWSLDDEAEMGHIKLSRDNDLIIIAPASANILAKAAHGIADDLATTCLLASNKPVMIAPAMNHYMWNNPATQTNVKTLENRGYILIPPQEGDMACGENGVGRIAEPEDILTAVKSFFFDKPLKGLHAIVTAGATYEPIDPVRFIGNRSSGKQGYAIAKELAAKGASVTLIAGSTQLPDPANIKVIHCETALEMYEHCHHALPADIAVFCAAVSDWRPIQFSSQKIKKNSQNEPPAISLVENPDILKSIAQHPTLRPRIVIGFAAETTNLIENATSKLDTKMCDWIVANEVGQNENGVEKAFGTDMNNVSFITKNSTTSLGSLSKIEVAQKIVIKITEEL